MLFSQKGGGEVPENEACCFGRKNTVRNSHRKAVVTQKYPAFVFSSCAAKNSERQYCYRRKEGKGKQTCGYSQKQAVITVTARLLQGKIPDFAFSAARQNKGQKPAGLGAFYFSAAAGCFR